MQVGSELPAATGSSARSDLQPETFITSLIQWFARAPAGKERVAIEAVDAPFVYTRLLTGRRSSYFRVLERLFGARRARWRDVFVSRGPVLFLMMEEAFLLYVIAGLLRAMMGRRTVGLLLRPMPIAASQRWRCRWRRAILRQLKRCSSIQTLSILPFSVSPALVAIADGWVYDFQLWDLTDEERLAIETLRGERPPGGCLVLTALGTQSRLKGFDLFVDSYARSTDLRTRFRFIACGKAVPAVAEHAAVLCEAGGVAVNRSVSDAELLGAYAASDAVWCLYPPAGDHATGILGRAAQLGLPVVVRQGSLSHRLCVVEDISHIAATPAGVAERLAGPLPPRDEARGRLSAMRFARESEATLRAAFGFNGVARIPSETDIAQASRLPSSPITF